MRKFNLIEMIVSIVVLGILLAIALINISANKKDAIRVAISSNTSTIQSAVDLYFLKENKESPTVNKQIPTIDDDFETLYSIRLFAHSAEGEVSKWLGYEKEDNVPKGTRILYNFSINDEKGFGPENKLFPDNKSSRSIMVHIYFQTKKSLIDTGLEPTFTSFEFLSSGGRISAKVNQIQGEPECFIDYTINNNKKTNAISTTSRVNWTYYANLPKGLTIVDYQWSVGNDKVTGISYPEGYNNISLKVKTSDGKWSNPTSYRFRVFEEKPVANIKIKQDGEYIENTININKPFTWENPIDTSYDPDKDGIVDFEWRGDKRDSYPVGTYTVGLRVKDSEDNWSDWTEFTSKVDHVWDQISGTTPLTIKFDFGEAIQLQEGIMKEIVPSNTRIKYTYYGSNTSTTSGLTLLGNDIKTLKEGYYRYYSIIATQEVIKGKTAENIPFLYEKKVKYQNQNGIQKEDIIYGNASLLKVNFIQTGLTSSYYTIPVDGFYSIEVYGAKGGTGGNSILGSSVKASGVSGSVGSYVYTKVYLEEGTILQINNGAAGTNGGNSSGQTGSTPRYGKGGGAGGGGGTIVNIEGKGLLLSAKGGNGGSGGVPTCTGVCAGYMGTGSAGIGGASSTEYKGYNGSGSTGGSGGGISKVSDFDFIETSTIGTATGITTGKTTITILP